MEIATNQIQAILGWDAIMTRRVCRWCSFLFPLGPCGSLLCLYNRKSHSRVPKNKFDIPFPGTLFLKLGDLIYGPQCSCKFSLVVLPSMTSLIQLSMGLGSPNCSWNILICHSRAGRLQQDTSKSGHPAWLFTTPSGQHYLWIVMSIMSRWAPSFTREHHS